jgi:hypothetical protein
VEACDDGVCVSGVSRCGPGEVCYEDSDSCRPLVINRVDGAPAGRGLTPAEEQCYEATLNENPVAVAWTGTCDVEEPGFEPNLMPPLRACFVAPATEQANCKVTATLERAAVTASLSIPVGVVAPSDGDGDGIPNTFDECPNTPSDEVPNAVGYSPSQVTDPPPERPVSSGGARTSCGACGAFGVISWSLLLLGLFALRYVGPRTPGGK